MNLGLAYSSTLTPSQMLKLINRISDSKSVLFYVDKLSVWPKMVDRYSRPIDALMTNTANIAYCISVD